MVFMYIKLKAGLHIEPKRMYFKDEFLSISCTVTRDKMAQLSTTWGYSKETCQDKRVFAEGEMHPAIGDLAQCGACKEQ